MVKKSPAEKLAASIPHGYTEAADAGPPTSPHLPGPLYGNDAPSHSGYVIPPELLRPDGTLTGNPLAPELPLDNSGAPAAVVADHPETMDQAMDAMGVSGIGGYVRPASFENQPVRPTGKPARRIPRTPNG
jgi:hypothetical protein